MKYWFVVPCILFTIKVHILPEVVQGKRKHPVQNFRESCRFLHAKFLVHFNKGIFKKTYPHKISGCSKDLDEKLAFFQKSGQPHVKKINRNDFLTKVGEGGGPKYIVKKKITLFCIIFYSNWPPLVKIVHTFYYPAFKISLLMLLNSNISITFLWLPFSVYMQVAVDIL